MNIAKVKVKKVTPNKGLIGFCSCVLNDCLYLGNIAIYTRLNNEDKIRLVFPVKKIGDVDVQLFRPLTKDFYYDLECAVLEKVKETLN